MSRNGAIGVLITGMLKACDKAYRHPDISSADMTQALVLVLQRYRSTVVNIDVQVK